MDATGLRQRKRLETRLALRRAAVGLALDAGGVDNLSIDAITDRANVSRRTFFNYFPTKEACFVWPLAWLVVRYVEAIDSLPVDLPVWDVVERAAITTISDPLTDLALVGAAEQLLAVSPALIGLVTADSSSVASFEGIRTHLADEIARRSGTNSTTDTYPHVMLECAGIGFRLALRRAATLGGDPAQHVQDVFALLRAGVPQPQRNAAGRTEVQG
jgi:AcrR family transcriptional regulator